MLNVLYISHESDQVLGSSKSLYNMLNSLKDKVFPTVLFPKKGPAHDFFKSKGVKCVIIPYPLNFTEKYGMNYYFAFVPRLIRDQILSTQSLNYAAKLFKDHKIDLIHSNSSTVDWGYKLSRRMNVPHVWHLREFQNLDFNYKPYRGWRYLLRQIHSSEATISITNHIKDHFKLSDKNNAFQLFNAVRRKGDIFYKAEKKPYFLFCGNLSKAKGIELAISSFALFSNKSKEYKLLFVGVVDPQYRKYLEKFSTGLGINDLIEFHDYTHSIDDFFRNATAFLMCSKNEAMGRVTVEAMFNGCPIIGYNGGGTKEIIRQGYNGYLFQTVQECADAMFSVISEDKKLDFIAKGHEVAEQCFSEESYCEKMMNVYSSVLSI